MGCASDVGDVGNRHDVDHAALLGCGDRGATFWDPLAPVRQGTEQRSDSALEILRQRYARGEINKDDFEKMKKDLQ
jgi:hypothetical protein